MVLESFDEGKSKDASLMVCNRCAVINLDKTQDIGGLAGQGAEDREW